MKILKFKEWLSVQRKKKSLAELDKMERARELIMNAWINSGLLDGLKKMNEDSKLAAYISTIYPPESIQLHDSKD